MTDFDLLHEFATTGSPDAFREVVRRHVDAVYAAARRQVFSATLAEDVTQAVFILLARKAAKFDDRGPLAGWLIKTTHFASRDALRAEARRKQHERKAAAMRPEQTADPASTAALSDALSAVVDHALVRLAPEERGIIVLRYLEGMTVVDVANVLGISTDAAAKRISRAVDRLRSIVTRNPAAPAPSWGLLPMAAVLEALPRTPAPTGLAEAAVAAATAAGGTSAAAAAIARAVGHTRLWWQVKVAAAALAGAAAIGTGTLTLVQAQAAAPAQSPSQTSQTSPPPTTAPAAQPPSGIVRASLRAGVTVEILGISDNARQNPSWWSADGTPLPRAPYARSGVWVGGAAGYRAREVAIRVTSNPSVSVVSVPLDTGSGYATGSVNDARGRTLPGIEAVAIAVPSDSAAGLHFRFDVATGPWQTAAALAPDVGETADDGATTYTIEAANDVRGEARISFSRTGLPAPHVARRIVAIDTAGREHPAYITEMSGSLLGQTGKLRAPLPLARIREIRYESRPYNAWIELRNLSPDPGRPARVEVVTSDDGPTTAPSPATRP
jgi:RNA polymerase sigma factor (sigma-70 family)